jgi:hypothetical protein
MAHLKKILVTPFFGSFPEWMNHFEPPKGYDWILDTDIENFKRRAQNKLGIDYLGAWGESKIWDYRCALGLLYEEEIRGYDYWGTMDFDIVFGDVNKFFTDEELIKWDVWSNHDTYVAGFWCLYRNSEEVNTLFLEHSDWAEILSHPKPFGWVENEFSRLLEQSGLRYKYSGDLQGDPYHPPFNLIKEDGKLFQDGIEIPMIHFRRTKIYPL